MKNRSVNCEFESKTVKTIVKNYYTTDTDKNIRNSIENSIFDYTFADKNDCENIRAKLNKLALEYYPNEAIVRSQFIKNVLSKTTNQTTIIELPILSSRCDIAKFNHISIAYEIKTEFDTPTRLDSQIENYIDLFERVYIIVPSQNAKKYSKLVSKNIGIYTYKYFRGKYIFNCVSKAEKNTVSSKKQLSQISIKFLRSHFNKFELGREELSQYILSKYSYAYINSLFKNYYKSKYRIKWDFINANIDDIYELDLSWFFKTNISPELFYESRKSLT